MSQAAAKATVHGFPEAVEQQAAVFSGEDPFPIINEMIRRAIAHNSADGVALARRSIRAMAVQVSRERGNDFIDELMRDAATAAHR
jgi:hypothetical protein